MKDLAVIEAPNPEMEALAIAVAMREARHLNKSAALVTPDRALARRVMASLTRWNLEFDDSGGDALMDTPAGVFARLTAEAAAKGLEPPTLLALLKHPLFQARRSPGLAEARHRINGTGAVARHPAASRKRRACARLRALPQRTWQVAASGSLITACADERRTRLSRSRTRSGTGADHAIAESASAAREVFRFLQTLRLCRTGAAPSRSSHRICRPTSTALPLSFEERAGSALASAFDDLLGNERPSGSDGPSCSITRMYSRRRSPTAWCGGRNHRARCCISLAS